MYSWWLALLLLFGAVALAAEGPEPIAPIPPPPAVDPQKLALGARLFADPRLSHDGTRACASCHDVQANGASANRVDRGRDGTPLPVNTLTVFNAALSFRFGWEGRFRTLEAEAAGSIANPALMGSSLDEVAKRLAADTDIAQRFQAVYGRAIDGDGVLDAIASYERTLITPGSRFDRWLAGDETALTPEERDGYAAFKSLGCAACHQGINIGGNLFQRHGIFHPLAAPDPELLRVPSLRNVAITAPYFHDGSAPTLHSAVRQMGYAQLNRTLTDAQVDSIVAFLGSLTARPDPAVISAQDSP